MPIAPVTNPFPAEEIAIFCEARGFLAKSIGHPFCSHMTHFLSSTEHLITAAEWLYNTTVSAQFSCPCWEIHESWCSLWHMDVIIGLTGILVSRDHFIQFVIRTYIQIIFCISDNKT